jgi:hypothetical protein
MPRSKTFWSPCFGMVSCRFGVGWMIHVATGNCKVVAGTSRLMPESAMVAAVESAMVTVMIVTAMKIRED